MKLPHCPAPARVSSRCPCAFSGAFSRALAACAALLPLGGLHAHAATPKKISITRKPLSATLRKIAENGAIVLGTRESSVPFSYLNRDQTIGYSYSIALRVVEDIRRRLNMPDLAVKNVMVTSSNRIS